LTSHCNSIKKTKKFFLGFLKKGGGENKNGILNTSSELEVHVELKTNQKCSHHLPAHFGGRTNTNYNVIDWGYPGVFACNQ